MSDRTKIILLKTLLVIGMISLCSISVLCILVIVIDIPESIATIMVCGCGITFAVSGVSFIVLRIIFGVTIRPKSVKAERLVSPYATYQDVSKYLFHRMQELQYQVYKSTTSSAELEVILFIKASFSRLNVLALVRTQELTDVALEEANDKVTEILLRYYQVNRVEQISDVVSMISLFCVDRVTPCFQDLLNSNIEQGLKNRRLPIGISFGSRTLYIARQEDGFAVTEYKRLHKLFLSIMGIDKTNIKRK